MKSLRSNNSPLYIKGKKYEFKKIIFIILIIILNYIEAKQFMWISGEKKGVQLANYGTKYVPHPDNIPGGRFFPCGWMDSSNNLYLFGGLGFNETYDNGI